LKKYYESHYITSEEMDELAEKTGLTRHQVFKINNKKRKYFKTKFFSRLKYGFKITV